jgi:ferrous iron transport protein A
MRNKRSSASVKALGSISKLQLSSKSKHSKNATLLHLRKGDHAILEHINLPEDDARRLMELGFLPGTSITLGQSAPGGDPQVFRVDGSEIALRRTTAAQLRIRTEPQRTM